MANNFTAMDWDTYRSLRAFDKEIVNAWEAGKRELAEQMFSRRNALTEVFACSNNDCPHQSVCIGP
jgi:hypothetical protein